MGQETLAIGTALHQAAGPRCGMCSTSSTCRGAVCRAARCCAAKAEKDDFNSGGAGLEAATGAAATCGLATGGAAEISAKGVDAAGAAAEVNATGVDAVGVAASVVDLPVSEALQN